MTATNNQIQTLIRNRKKRETNKIIITNIVLLYSANSICHSILSEHNLCGIMTLVFFIVSKTSIYSYKTIHCFNKVIIYVLYATEVMLHISGWLCFVSERCLANIIIVHVIISFIYCSSIA